MTRHEHAYDDPDLDSMNFLLCIMRDPAVSLHLRMDAAAKLLPLYQKTQTIQITITGGLPNLSPDEFAARVERRSRSDDFADLAWDTKPLVH